jgi:hypothetical protein
MTFSIEQRHKAELLNITFKAACADHDAIGPRMAASRRRPG